MKKSCPVCKGTGRIPRGVRFRELNNEMKVETARALRRRGFSIRQVMHFLGYKSPQSVQHLLDSAKD